MADLAKEVEKSVLLGVLCSPFAFLRSQPLTSHLFLVLCLTSHSPSSPGLTLRVAQRQLAVAQLQRPQLRHLLLRRLVSVPWTVAQRVPLCQCPRQQRRLTSLAPSLPPPLPTPPPPALEKKEKIDVAATAVDVDAIATADVAPIVEAKVAAVQEDKSEEGLENWVHALSIDSAFPGMYPTQEQKKAFVLSKMDFPPAWRKGAGLLKPGPTPIQCKVLPRIMAKVGLGPTGQPLFPGWSTEEANIVAQGEGGSGKTGAYLSAALLRLRHDLKLPQVVIVAHTNALIDGIMKSARNLLPERFQGLVSVATGAEVLALPARQATTAQVIVCMPGQLAKLTHGGGIKRGPGPTDWRNLTMVVLDEADLLLSVNESAAALHDFIVEQAPAAQRLLFSATYASLQPHFPNWNKASEWVCGGKDFVRSGRPHTGERCSARMGADTDDCTACGFPFDGVPPGPLYGCPSAVHSTNGGEPYCRYFALTPAVAEQRRYLKQLLSLFFPELSGGGGGGGAGGQGSTILEPIFTLPPATRGALPRKCICIRTPSGVPKKVQHIVADFSPLSTGAVASESCFTSKVHFLSGLLWNFAKEQPYHLKTLVMCQENDTALRVMHALRECMPRVDGVDYTVLSGTRTTKLLEGDWRDGRLLFAGARDDQAANAAQREEQRANLTKFSSADSSATVLVGTYGTIARGLDITGLTLVVLWDMPQSHEGGGGPDLDTFKHAIKRVGRETQASTFDNQTVLYMVGDNSYPGMGDGGRRGGAAGSGGSSSSDCRALALAQKSHFELLCTMERLELREVDGRPFYTAQAANLKGAGLAPLAAELHTVFTEHIDVQAAYQESETEGQQGSAAAAAALATGGGGAQARGALQ